MRLGIDASRAVLAQPTGTEGYAYHLIDALLPLLNRNENRSFLEEAQERMEDWWELMRERSTRMDMPMKPQVVAWELGKRLRDDAIVCCDSGTIATWWARQIKARRGQMHTLSGTLATMACGLPYANAAQWAYPDRQVIAFVGDGGFTMLMGELATAVKYDLPIKVVIIKNNVLGQIKWEQMVFLGNPEYGVELKPIDFATFAEAVGATGFTVEDPSECGAILEQALNTPGPVVVEAVVDPLEPPMPAEVDATQALHFAESLVKGQPKALEIAGTILEDRIKSLT